MKKILRRTVSVLCAAAIALSCLSASMFAFAADNLALAGTAFADSLNNTAMCNKNATIPEYVLDGDKSTRWQGDKQFTATEANAPYVGIYWSAAQTFNTIIIRWEVSRPTEDGYKLYYMTSVPNTVDYTEPDTYMDGEEEKQTQGHGKVFKVEGEGNEWTPVTFTPVRVKETETTENDDGTSSSTDYYVDTITLSESLSAAAIKVVGLKDADSKNKTMSVYDIEVYDYSGTPYDVAYVRNAMNKVEKAFGTPSDTNNYGYSANSWAAFTEAYATASLAATACAGEIVGNIAAYPEQSDLDAVGDALLAAAQVLAGDGNVAENVMANGIMYWDPSKVSGFTGNINYRSITDGLYTDNNNVYQPKQNDTGDNATVFVRLANPADINKFVVIAETTGYDMSIQYTTADVSAVASYEAMKAVSFEDLCTAGDLKYSYDPGTAIYSYGFDTVADVTAIKIVCNKGVDGYFKIMEIEAYCDDATDNYNTAVKDIASTDGTQKFFYTNVTAEAVAENQVIVANYSVTRDGVTKEGSMTINNAYYSITLGGNTITSASVGHSGDYVTGILFTNVAENDVIEVTFEVADASVEG